MNRYVEQDRDQDVSVESWVNLVANEFIGRVLEEMDTRGVTQAGLARKLDKSAAYVSKVLHGGETRNFTIETMISFARALDCVLHVTIANENVAVTWNPLPQRSEADFVESPVPSPVSLDWGVINLGSTSSDEGLVWAGDTRPTKDYSSPGIEARV